MVLARAVAILANAALLIMTCEMKKSSSMEWVLALLFVLNIILIWL